MSDGLSDAHRMQREAENYFHYLEALKSYLEYRTEALFAPFLKIAARVPACLRGWGDDYSREIKEEEAREYVGKLLSGDMETWAILLRRARLERSEFTGVLQSLSPFARKVLLFYDYRDKRLVIESAFNTDAFLKISGLSRLEAEGKYLIALPIPETGVVIIRADKKEQS